MGSMLHPHNPPLTKTVSRTKTLLRDFLCLGDRCGDAYGRHRCQGGFMLKGRTTILTLIIALSILIALSAPPSALSQNSSAYQPGTIMKAVRHPSAGGQSQQYDVSVKVLNTLYTVLYTPPPGVNTVEYVSGLEILVLVKKDTLVFNSRVSGSTEVPILARETVASDNGIDFSKAPSEYYSMKLRNLSENLDLNEDQQTRIQPILEQEAGELNYVWGNPALSQKDKLEKLRQAVRTSDRKMKPLLTHAQWEKLQTMRQQQERELNQRMQEAKAEQHK